MNYWGYPPYPYNQPSSIDELTKAIEFLQKQKETFEAEKKKKEPPKGRTFTVLEAFGLIIGFGPFVGMFWKYLFEMANSYHPIIHP